MSRKLSKPIIATLIISVLVFSAAAVASVGGGFFVGSTNTVTQVNYPTITATSVVTTTGAATVTGTPYEILTTVTTTGAQTYTASTTVTTGVSTTVTSTAAEDYYNPLAMYYTATSSEPFYRQLSPIVTTANDGTALSQTVLGDGELDLSIVSTSTTYYDLGFYYEFQNLGSLNTFLPGGSSHTITIQGTGFAVNLWVNPEGLTWGPGPSSTEVITGSSGFAYGFSGTTGTLTVSASTPFYMTTAAGTCAAGGTYDITQLTTPSGSGGCGISTSATFAFWIGIDSTSATTTTGSITAMYSTPYP